MITRLWQAIRKVPVTSDPEAVREMMFTAQTHDVVFFRVGVDAVQNLRDLFRASYEALPETANVLNLYSEFTTSGLGHITKEAQTWVLEDGQVKTQNTFSKLEVTSSDKDLMQAAGALLLPCFNGSRGEITTRVISPLMDRLGRARSAKMHKDIIGDPGVLFAFEGQQTEIPGLWGRRSVPDDCVMFGDVTKFYHVTPPSEEKKVVRHLLKIRPIDP